MSEIKIYNAADLSRDDWRDLQGISREAFASTLNRPQAEIDALVAWDEPTLFYESHTRISKWASNTMLINLTLSPVWQLQRKQESLSVLPFQLIMFQALRG